MRELTKREKEAMKPCDCNESFLGDGYTAICNKCGHCHITNRDFFNKLDVNVATGEGGSK